MQQAIFYVTDHQKIVAECILQEVQRHTAQPIVTEITMAGPFYEAEAYHQKYAERTGRGLCHVPYKPL